MAESLSEKNVNCKQTEVKTDNSSNVECAVCLQICVHPAELPCGHIFCYLCIKGIVNQGRRCAMCRQSIPVDYLEKPRLLKPVDLESSNKAFEDGHLWFYEGHNGWWQYDERTSVELESAYQKGERCCELLVAGYLYIADFDAMLQYRQNDPSRRRRIKRDLATISSKGIAGLKTTKSNSDSNCFNNPEFVSNILVPDLQSLHISGQQMPRSNLSTTSRLNSYSPDQQNSATTENAVRSRDRRLSLDSLMHSPASEYQNLTSVNDSTLLPTVENFELDNTIHDTLDWTIEQIEALNSELSSDYENLFRDVNNYENLNTVLDNSRLSLSSNYNCSRGNNFNHRLSRSLENDHEIRNVHSYRLNRSGEFPESDQTFLNRNNERALIRPSILSNIESDAQLISRLREGPRIRHRRGTSKQPHSIRDHETLF